MNDYRSFLMGAGVGILLSASLMALGMDQTASAPTLEQMKPLAEQQGYLIVDRKTWEDQKNITLDQLEKEAAKNGYVLVKTKESEDTKPKTDTQKTATGASQAKASQQAAQAAASTATIRITPGMSSESVEDLLVKDKIIPPDSKFSDELERRHLMSKIRTGTFEFKADTPLDEVITTITKN